MNTKLRTRSMGLAALALTASMGLAACGSEDDSTSASDTTSSSSAPSESTSESPMESESAAPASDAPFGPGCSGVPTDPNDPGSVEGMAQDPVATAASNNPLLTTLTAAVQAAGLVDTLNSAENLTVFAPTDDAFAAIPKKDLNALLKDKAALTQVLTHHVIGERLSPDMVAGEHETLAKDMLTVDGSGEDFTIGDATVVCGNVQTANATVYVVDQVLMPQM